MQRVHPMPDPLTDYLRFEIERGYSLTIPAGEQIHTINSRLFEEIVIDNGFQIVFEQWKTRDYWLFDDNDLFLMYYKEDGTFVEVKRENNHDSVLHAVKIRDTFLSNPDLRTLST